MIKAFKDRLDQRVVFVDNKNDGDVRGLLNMAVSASPSTEARVELMKASLKANRTTLDDMRVLVVGMPNVGKSSLLNALRRVGVKKGKPIQSSLRKSER